MVFQRKRANVTTWYASFKDAKGTWVHERSGTDKRAAERLEAKRRKEVETGTYAGPRLSSSVTLATWAADWLSKRRNKTADHDAARMRDHVLPVLGTTRMDELRAVQCIDYVRGLVDSGMNPKTVANVWGVLRTCLRDALIAELITWTPVMPKGVIPARRTRITKIYSNEAAELLMGHTSPEYMIATIGFYTGMRIGEICGLRWEDWETDDAPNRLGSLIVCKQYDGQGANDDTKTGRVRIVPVHPRLAEELHAWAQCCHGMASGASPIAPYSDGGHFNRNTAYKAWLRHCKTCGVDSLGVHRTRHTAITAMRRGGAPREVVEKITHNSTGTIVDRYTHDWSILCAAVACADYSCRVAPRVAALNPAEKRTAQGGVVLSSLPGQSNSQQFTAGQLPERLTTKARELHSVTPSHVPRHGHLHLSPGSLPARVRADELSDVLAVTDCPTEADTEPTLRALTEFAVSTLSHLHRPDLAAIERLTGEVAL